MTKTKAPQATPSPSSGKVTPHNEVKAAKNYRTEFFVAVINMSWQLAIVVLVPIIGGFELDNATDMLPVFTIIGFIVAMAGMAAVVWRQLQLFSPPPSNTKAKGGKI